MTDTLFDRASLTHQGFGGFVTFEELWNTWLPLLPTGPGVYVVLREKEQAPSFLDVNPGGRFKGKDPTASREALTEKWIQAAHVIYVGKGDNLRRRLKEYARFGRGDPVGHWGGRYIWQLADSSELSVGWRRCDATVTARSVEMKLLQEFVAQYGRLPFANLVR